MSKGNYLDSQSSQQLLQNFLRKIRLEEGLRQIDLAEKLGKPQSYISKYENGEKHLDILELKNICNAMGISLVDFVQQFESLINSQD